MNAIKFKWILIASLVLLLTGGLAWADGKPGRGGHQGYHGGSGHPPSARYHTPPHFRPRQPQLHYGYQPHHRGYRHYAYRGRHYVPPCPARPHDHYRHRYHQPTGAYGISAVIVQPGFAAGIASGGGW